MKTAMKRLLSFVLVAMMLVSVVPFQASAADGDPETVTLTCILYEYVTGSSDPGVEKNKVVDDAVTKGANCTVNNVYTALGISDDDYDKTELYYAVVTDGVQGPWILMTENVACDSDMVFGLNVFKPQTEFNVTYKVSVVDGETEKGSYTNTVVAGSVAQASVDAAIAEAMKGVDAEYKNYDYTISPAVGTTVTGDITVNIKVPVWKEFEVVFEADGEIIKTLTTKKHVLDKSKAPGDPEKDDYNFLRWDTAKEGFELNFSNLANPLTANYKFYARFEKTNEDKADKFSDIEIVAKRYADGREKQEKLLMTIPNEKDGSNVYDILRANQKAINDEINDLGWDGEWVDNTFYMNSKGSEELDKDMELDGDCTVYVMVGEGDPVKVQLYVHTSYKEEPTYIVNMFGYESDDILKKADINETLEKKWPDRTYSWKGMYSDKDWTDILGEKGGVTAKSSYYLSKYFEDDNDHTVNVHIYATRTYVNNSDNPKTGDTILMAVTAMGLSAAALAAVYFVFKKKQTV